MGKGALSFMRLIAAEGWKGLPLYIIKVGTFTDVMNVE